MDPKLLQYFLRVAEIRSINKAALDLQLSQPALSRHIAALEHDVGTPLFVRDRQGVKLTPSGKLLLERAQPILRQISLLRDELGRTATEQVSIAMPVSMLRMVTGPLTAWLIQEHHHLQLRIYEGINNQLHAWMTEGVIDVGLIWFHTEPIALFEQTPLVREQLYLIGDASTDLEIEQPVPVSALAQLKLILPGRPNYIRHLVESALRRADLHYTGVLDGETLPLCMELVQQGLGYSVVPAAALHEHPYGERIKAAPVRGMTITWALSTNMNREHAAGVRLVRDALKQLIIGRIESGLWRGGELVRAGVKVPR